MSPVTSSNFTTHKGTSLTTIEFLNPRRTLFNSLKNLSIFSSSSGNRFFRSFCQTSFPNETGYLRISFPSSANTISSYFSARSAHCNCPFVIWSSRVLDSDW
ncbi:unnamed protein product, partial [Meganyctiphanes norvegica]